MDDLFRSLIVDNERRGIAVFRLEDQFHCVALDLPLVSDFELFSIGVGIDPGA